MAYSVKTVPNFDREMKRLAKKYASLKDEYQELIKELKENPEKGSPLGNNIYKIRLAIASKGKGKSGGARIISYLKTLQENIYLLSIYDKGKKSTISDSEIQQILESEIEL
jgi:mRNA-degrading endonuclease RelE of RelBE toxin-antitoxin system